MSNYSKLAELFAKFTSPMFTGPKATAAASSCTSWNADKKIFSDNWPASKGWKFRDT